MVGACGDGLGGELWMSALLAFPHSQDFRSCSLFGRSVRIIAISDTRSSTHRRFRDDSSGNHW